MNLIFYNITIISLLTGSLPLELVADEMKMARANYTHHTPKVADAIKYLVLSKILNKLIL